MTLLDDVDSRAGSVVSLARTVVGLYLRRLGGWISIADLIRVLNRLDVDTGAARTAVARLKARGLLVPEQQESLKGYRLSEDAVPMLEAGDRRIFHPRRMADGDPWCLVSFSIPERQRATRHQLRRRLHWIGAGLVSPALWICPGSLAGEVEQILDDLDVRPFATLFEATTLTTAGTLRSAAQEWWDLDALAAVHRGFIERIEPLVRDDGDTLGRYVAGIDAWRPIPSLDPGLPPAMLPHDWPGLRSEQLYGALATFADGAWADLRTLIG